jgi:predicted nucleic acid-binding protein
MKLFFDSSAWIEYFEGSLNGEKVYNFLKGKNEVYSISIIISEIVSKAKRMNQDFEIPFRAIMRNSKFFEVAPEIAREAGVFHAEMKKKKRDFGLVDATIWVVAEKLGAKLVTCDYHFKNFKNVVFLK